MKRAEENKITLENIAHTSDEVNENVSVEAYATVMLLADISKSLAMIADAVGGNDEQ